MGWKSTLTISRDKAIAAITAEMSKVYQMSNSELGSIMGDTFGDDPDKPYYGYNFDVVDKVDENEEY